MLKTNACTLAPRLDATLQTYYRVAHPMLQVAYLTHSSSKEPTVSGLAVVYSKTPRGPPILKRGNAKSTIDRWMISLYDFQLPCLITGG